MTPAEMRIIADRAVESGDTSDPELNDMLDLTPGELVDALGPIYRDLIDLFESDPGIMGEESGVNLKPGSNPRWIEHLGQTVASMTEEDIRLRTITSNGRPMFLQLGLYRGGKRVATAGRGHRIGFASKGIDDRWTAQAQSAIDAVVSKA